MSDLIHHLICQLDHQREALLAKLDGLSEREVRLPRTPTGTNLLGLVKHCLNVEHVYFGPTFGTVMDRPTGLLQEADFENDPQVDWFATAEESTADVVALYRRVIDFANAQILDLGLDHVGRVPHWPAERREVTLGQVGLQVLQDLARHAGHADILREQIDGTVGFWGQGDNLPPGYDWAGYVARLTDLAEQA